MSKGQSGRGFKFMLLAFALLVLPLLMYLGVWQLSRAEDKQRLIDSYLMANQGERFVGKSLSGSGFRSGFRKVSIEGVLESQRYFLLDNRTRNGRVGYEVIGVLKPDDGDVWWVVNFGWIVSGNNRLELPEIKLPLSRQILGGVAHQPEKGFTLAEDQWDGRWPYVIQSLDIAHMSAVIQHELSPWVMRLEEALLMGVNNNWPVTTMSPEKHLAYAWQWFSMALALLLLLIWSCRNLNREESSDE